MTEQDVENELLDYEEDEEPQAPTESTPAPPKKDVKGSYVSIHSSGFRDFLLKPELLRAIVDCGFEHPSEGALPQLPARPRGGGHPTLGVTDMSLTPSPARVHSAGHPGYGCPVSGQVWDGQDGGLCAGHPAADRAGQWTGGWGFLYR